MVPFRFCCMVTKIDNILIEQERTTEIALFYYKVQSNNFYSMKGIYFLIVLTLIIAAFSLNIRRTGESHTETLVWNTQNEPKIKQEQSISPKENLQVNEGNTNQQNVRLDYIQNSDGDPNTAEEETIPKQNSTIDYRKTSQPIKWDPYQNDQTQKSSPSNMTSQSDTSNTSKEQDTNQTQQNLGQDLVESDEISQEPQEQNTEQTRSSLNKTKTEENNGAEEEDIQASQQKSEEDCNYYIDVQGGGQILVQPQEDDPNIVLTYPVEFNPLKPFSQKQQITTTPEMEGTETPETETTETPEAEGTQTPATETTETPEAETTENPEAETTETPETETTETPEAEGTQTPATETTETPETEGTQTPATETTETPEAEGTQTPEVSQTPKSSEQKSSQPSQNIETEPTILHPNFFQPNQTKASSLNSKPTLISPVQKEASTLSSEPRESEPIQVQPISLKPLVSQPVQESRESTHSQPQIFPIASSQQPYIETESISSQSLVSQPVNSISPKLTQEPTVTNSIESHPIKETSEQPQIEAESISSQPLSIKPISIKPISTLQQSESLDLQSGTLVIKPIESQPISVSQVEKQQQNKISQPFVIKPIQSQPILAEEALAQKFQQDILSSSEPQYSQPISVPPIDTSLNTEGSLNQDDISDALSVIETENAKLVTPISVSPIVVG